MRIREHIYPGWFLLDARVYELYGLVYYTTSMYIMEIDIEIPRELISYAKPNMPPKRTDYY